MEAGALGRFRFCNEAACLELEGGGRTFDTGEK